MKSVTKGQMLCGSTNMEHLEKSKFTKMESRIAVTRGWRKEGCVDVRVPAGEDVNVLEMDSGDGCTRMWMCLMPMNCT